MVREASPPVGEQSEPAIELTTQDLEIVGRNIEKIKAEMAHALNRESIGGNAGAAEIGGKKYPCAGLNALMDIESGEIIEFTNYRDLKKLSAQHGRQLDGFTFKCPVDMDISRGAKIFEYPDICMGVLEIYWGVGLGKDQVSPRAKEVIRQTAREYNLFKNRGVELGKS